MVSTTRCLRILRGKDLELVSREVGTTAADLSRWRDSFLEAGAASLKTRPDDDREWELKAMREKIGEMTPSRRMLAFACRAMGPTNCWKQRSSAWREVVLVVWTGWQLF
tara:strand:+ start:378 stop:704 length:327 start_codon:yes stop_codon:yes gene_type:complete